MLGQLTPRRARRRWPCRQPLIGLAAAVLTAAAGANPQGPQVVSGRVDIANPNPRTLEITNSPAAIINWQAFDIAPGETTRFVQESAASAVLNRVVEPNASAILGRLESNGRVFLVNPTGILIGRDAVVDTHGLVLSTLGIEDSDFLAGRLDFAAEPGAGQITNHGYVKSAPGGEVVFVAPRILNAPQEGNEHSALIESPDGELILAAGYEISITSLDDPNISFEVQAPENEVVNLGRLIAEGGTARVLAGTIRHSGEINADSVGRDAAGRVVLTASHRVTSTGDSLITARGGEAAAGGDVAITAAAPAADEPGASPPATVSQAGTIDVGGRTGGRVTVHGEETRVSGSIEASGTAAGGRVHVLGERVALAGASVTANAGAGPGGQIRIGGERAGADTLPAAAATRVDGGSRLQADALEAGDGGTIVVWSDERTDYHGLASARAGLAAGDGGFVEVSGKARLEFAGEADVGSPAGRPGTLLLDPRNIFILPGDAATASSDPTPFAGDRLGASGISILGNGNILIVNQNADAEGLVDAGEILLFDPLGNVIGALPGNAENERLGSFGSLVNANGDRLFPSPNASAGGLAQAGAVILFDVELGVEIGRTGGISANELFGQTLSLVSGNFVVRSPLADAGGNADAGSVAVVDGATGTLLNRINGASAGERFGDIANFFLTAPDTFLVRAPGADAGGQADAGSVVLMSALSGDELGRVEGGAAGDRFGDVVDFFGLPAGTYLVRADDADTGGLTDNGTAVLVDAATGLEIGRASGLADGDRLGQRAPVLRGSGNYFLQVPEASIGGNAQAGSLVLVDGSDGTRIGSVDGNSANERFAEFIDTFTLGFNDVLVTSTDHDNGALADAGGVFVVADVELGGGAILRGSTLGVSAGERFGSFGFTPVGSAGLAFRSPDADIGGNMDAGSVVLVSRAAGTELGRVDGGSAGEQLGLNPIDTRFNGNYFIRSPFADPGGIGDAGTVILADGASGNEIGRVDGDTAGERFGSFFDAFSLLNGDLLVFSEDHGGTAGLVAQLAASDLGGGDILRGSIAGGQAGDRVGRFGAFVLPDGNYVVRAPEVGFGSDLEVGSVFVVEGASGAELLRIDGDTPNERLGDLVDFFFLPAGDEFVIRSPAHGGEDGGAVFFVDAYAGALVNTFTGDPGDRAGSDPLLFTQTGNIIVPMPSSDDAAIDAGAVAVLDGGSFAFLGRTNGQSANELFGAAGTIDTFSLCCSEFLVHSRFRSLSGPGSNEGAVATIDAGTGTLLGEVLGQEPGDELGELNFAQELASGDFLLFNPSADTPGGSLVDAGAVVLVDRATFQEKNGDGNGRFHGQSGLEMLGSNPFAIEHPSGNYFMQSRFADPGAVADAGTLYLASGASGLLIGQADGNTAGEQFGLNLDSFTLQATGSDDVLVRSPAGNAGAGTIVQIAGADLGGGAIIRGRIDGAPGAGLAEALGSLGVQLAPDGQHYFARAPGADAGALVDAGAIYFVDALTGTLSNRLEGVSANELLGNNSPFQGSAGNLFVRSNGDQNAGRVVVASPEGALLGEATGNNPGELFGSNFQFVGDDMWVIAPQHNNAGEVAAGGIFALANEDLGGGDIVRASLLGEAAGDQLGSLGINFFNGNYFVRVPNADAGGIVDAGTVLLIDQGLAELGRTSGTSAGELFGQQFFTSLATGDVLFRSPLADVDGMIDAGTVKLVDGASGELVGETTGTSAEERFGSTFPLFLIDGGIAFTSPDADAGGLADTGAIVQIDPDTGLEVQRVTGISAGERLGAFGRFNLPGGRLLFPSPDADVNGLADAGRLVFFDPAGDSAGVTGDLLFADSPGNDSVLTTGTIENALAGGGTLVLQANNDIVFQAGARILASAGRLELQAGRSVKFLEGSTVIVPELSITANESADNGVETAYRSPGSGDLVIEDAQVVGNFDISAQTVAITAGLDPDAVYEPADAGLVFEAFLEQPLQFELPAAFALGTTSLSVDAERILLAGSESAGGFAALVSLGELTVTAGELFLTPGSGEAAHALFLGLGGLGDFVFDTCEGCGDDLILNDPFLEPGAQSGFFVSGIFQEPTVDAILAQLEREDAAAAEDADEDEEREDDEEEVRECGI